MFSTKAPQADLALETLNSSNLSDALIAVNSRKNSESNIFNSLLVHARP